MKKRSVIVISLLALIFVAGLVSAAETGDASGALTPIVDMISGAVTAIFNALKAPLSALVGSTGTGSDATDIFFGKVLLIILITSIVYVVLSKTMTQFFSDKIWALWIVSIAISLLGVRFLKADMIYATILPSSTFAVAVAAGLPFVLYFFLIEGFPKTVRRIAWIFFGVIFLGLYTLRLPDLTSDAAKMIYPLTALLAFVMVWLDGTLRGWMIGLKIEKAQKGLHSGQIGILQQKLANVHDTYNKLLNQGREHLYLGISPATAGSSKLGAAMYYSDVDYYEKAIRKILKKI